MKKLNYRWIFSYEALPFFFALIIDQASKAWASQFFSSMSWGPLNIQTTFNHGFFLGHLGHIPPSTKMVVVSTLGAFVISAYIFARLIIPMRSNSLKMGLAFLAAGILGNVLDRMNGNGGVIDFIFIQTESWISPVWNMADMFQVLGHALIFLGIFQDSRHYWNNKELRKNFWVDSQLQTRICLQYLGVAFSMGLMSSMMSYAFLKTTLDSLVHDKTQVEIIMYSYIMTTAFLQTCLMLMVVFVARYFSAKVAGPFFAIKRFLRDLISGSHSKFKLREHDDFKDIEPLLNDVSDKLKDRDKREERDEDEPPEFNVA